MSYTLSTEKRGDVGSWLMLGVFMILVQVVLGGITRLTQSGLSITNWDVILGTLPPMNKADWLAAFDAYKQIPQYEVLNKGMSLQEFKWIYFWEYFHRLWARILGLVFLFPLVWFVVKGRIARVELPKYIFILILGGMQGFMGWIMVKSGLEERIFVDPLKLMLHLLLAAALVILVYRLALENLRPKVIRLFDKRHRNLLILVLVLAIIQVGFGGLVAGSRAALAYPTWPKMGDAWIPGSILAMKPIWHNFLENAATLQFMHRIMAYILVIVTVVIGVKGFGQQSARGFQQANQWMIGLIGVQLLLGILTVISSETHIPVFLGVVHQLTALLFLLAVVRAHYAFKYQ